MSESINVLKVDRNYYLNLPCNYEYISTLGKGAYGIVVQVKDAKTNQMYAIKKCQNIHINYCTALRTLREIRILRLVRHPFIVHFNGILPLQQNLNSCDLYYIMEPMKYDLSFVLNREYDVDIQCIMFQLLQAVKYLHESNIVHRDLKPKNILISEDLKNIKICDFGLAKYLIRHDMSQIRNVTCDKKGDYDNTNYVTTRWYRSPEVLCRCRNYSYGIDLWSIGCILGEILFGEPLFPGNDTDQQLELIVDRLGRPPSSFIDSASSKQMRDKLRTFRSKNHDFEDYIKTEQKSSLDLLNKLLIINPAERWNSTQALNSTFFDSLRSGPLDYTTIAPLEVTTREHFSFELDRKDTLRPHDIIKEEIVDEIVKYNSRASTLSVSGDNIYVEGVPTILKSENNVHDMMTTPILTSNVFNEESKGEMMNVVDENDSIPPPPPPPPSTSSWGLKFGKVLVYIKEGIKNIFLGRPFNRGSRSSIFYRQSTE